MTKALKKSKKKSPPPKAISFKTKVKTFESFEGMHYLEVAKPLIQKLGGKFLVRLVCTVNGQVTFQCGLQGLGGGTGAGWVGLNKTRMRELGVTKGSTVKVELKPDKSKYGLPMPAELKELLRQDEEGHRRFELLSPGKQRNILHYVAGPQSSDRKLDRAVTVIENLKRLEEGRETANAIFGIKSKFNRQS